MKKSNFLGNSLRSAALVLTITALAPSVGCSLKKSEQSQNDTVDNSINANIPGVGSVQVPVSDAIVSRLENGLIDTRTDKTLASTGINHISSTNFKNTLALVSGNLPTTVNPLSATGYDQVPLLVYAACSDVSQAAAKTAYGVDFTAMANAPATKTSLIAEGVKMLDQHVGGLASTGPAAADVSNVLSKLIDDNNQVAGMTTRLQFISVCMAANSFGVTMRGF